ncbi:PAS domain S-box protein [Lusitaniella coriacea LEGE 07157]|uniref:PAS domain S-box protein n=1 Tax=Lusitaniella coriacea LEGE 07157 TaxID=945747 RepID=A0A8J7ARD7_9CYAN|nr:PAS domain S-box protein [Lusitaniella coriacea]MBE9114626.1 PAS domain S-box protein [Lusitaniella coriacea LEGE 07157]
MSQISQSWGVVTLLIPHGHGYSWKFNLVSLHVASDGIIALAYFTISAILFFCARKRKNLPQLWIFLLFGAFIICCGITHLLEIWTLWYPHYWISGFAKAITAAISLYSALQLISLVPQFLALKSPAQLEAANRKLAQEIAQRCKAEQALQESKIRYRSILNDQTDLIARYLPDGTLTFINQAYCRYFDLNQEDLLGSNSPPHLSLEGQEKLKQGFSYLTPDNPVETIERQVSVKGEMRWTQWTNRAIFDDAGNIKQFQTVGRDIHDRVQAQNAQHESNERLQLALEGSGDGLWDWNIATGEIYLSPRWLGMLGYAPGELPENVDTWGELIHPEDQPWVMEILNAHLQDSNIPYHFDYRIRTRSGEWKWIGNYGKVVTRDEKGTPLRMAGTHKDISDRVRAEEALHQQEELFRLTLKHSPILLFNQDTELHYTWFCNSPATCGIYDPEAIIGKRDTDIFCEDDAQRLIALKRKVLESGIGLRTETFITFEGKICYYDLSIEPFRDRTGEIVGITCTSLDISDRKHTEETLQERESILSSFYDSAPLMMGVVEVTEDDILHISDNVATAAFFGTTPEAMRQQWSSHMGAPKETIDLWLAHYKKSQATGKPVYFERPHETPEGTKYLAATVSKIAQIADDRPQFCYVVEDITERKKVEKQIEESLREKETLLQEIHHRVKNNLQVICSLLNLQMRSIQDKNVLEQLRESQNRTRTMALIHEKLYQSKNLSKIDFSAYLGDLVANLSRSYSVQNVSFDLDFCKDFFLDIDAAIPCGLIVNELVSNSIKHAFSSEEKGKIFIQTHLEKESAMILKIGDNGKGLPSEFNFAKAKTLGLKLVKNLARQIRGELNIESSHEGTHLKLTLNKKSKG